MQKNILPFQYQLKKKTIMLKRLYTKVKSNCKFIDTCRFMSSKLSDLVDDLSEINNNKGCEKCMERKNIRSECEFIGLKIID